MILSSIYWLILNYSECSKVKKEATHLCLQLKQHWPVPRALPLWLCCCLTSAPSGRCSPGNISVWHQSPLPPKKVTRAWVSLSLHLLPAEVWGNFLQVVHGEGERASRLCCSLWYCQERVMALCSNSHCRLTECDFGPVFLCITTTVSKKGDGKKTERA